MTADANPFTGIEEMSEISRAALLLRTGDWAVNGKLQNFTSPQNPHPRTDHQNLPPLTPTARPVQNFVKIRPLGLPGKRVKYNQKFSFMPFLRNSPTGQTCRQMFTLGGLKDAVCLSGFR